MTSVNANDPRCPECGEPIGMTSAYCLHCWADLSEEHTQAETDTDADWNGTSKLSSSPQASGSPEEPAAGGGSLLYSDRLLDTLLIPMIGLIGGFVIGLIGFFVVTAVVSGVWGFGVGILAWLGATTYLVRQRTVQESISKAAYGIALASMSIPLIVFSTTWDSSNTGDQLLDFALMVGICAVLAVIVGGIGFLVERFTSEGDEHELDSGGREQAMTTRRERDMTVEEMVFEGAALLMAVSLFSVPYIVDRLLFVRNKSGFDVQRNHRHKHPQQALVCSTDRRSLVVRQVVGLWLLAFCTLLGHFLLTNISMLITPVLGLLVIGVGVLVEGLLLRGLLNNWGATLVLDTEGIRWQARFDSWFVPWDAIDDRLGATAINVNKMNDKQNPHPMSTNPMSTNPMNRHLTFKSFQSYRIRIWIKDLEAVEREGRLSKLKVTDTMQYGWTVRILSKLQGRSIPANEMSTTEKEELGSRGTFTWGCLDISADALETTVQHFLTHPDDRERREHLESLIDRSPETPEIG